jgi:hypothetical protein
VGYLRRIKFICTHLRLTEAGWNDELRGWGFKELADADWYIGT